MVRQYQARKTCSPIFTRIQKTESSSSEPPPYSSAGNLTSTPAAMRELAIQASRLFLQLFPSGEALSPCGRFLGSPSAGEGEVAGADECLWGFGVPPLPTPLPPPLPPLSPLWGVLVGAWVFWRSASCRLCFFFYVDQFGQSSWPGHHPMLSTLVGGITYKRGGKVAGHGSCMAVVCKVIFC